MRARNPSNSKASSSTVKKSLDQEKLSRYVYRLCVQEATISTTIFTRMFRRDPSSQNKRPGNLKARGGEKNPDHRCNCDLRLSHNRATQNHSQQQSPCER